MHRHTLAAFMAGLFTLPVQAEPQRDTTPSLDEIVVTATRYPTPIRETLSDVTLLERVSIDQMDHVSLPDLLSTLAGTQVTTNGGRGDTALLSLRGGNSGHTAILVDGLRISSATLGSTAFQAIPLAQIGRIEVVRGPVSSLYGTDALSGVVQIFTPEGAGAPAPDLHLGVASHGTRMASAGYGGQIGDTRFNLRVGLEHSDGFSSIKEAKGGLFDMYNPDKDAYTNQNASAKLSHRVSRDLEIGAGIFHARADKHYDAVNCDAFAAVCTADFDNQALQKLQSIQAHAEYHVNENWETTLRIGQSLDYSRNLLLDPSTGIVTIDHYQTRQNQAIWQNNLKVWRGLVTVTGEMRNQGVASSKTFVVSEQETDSLSLGYQIRQGDHAIQASARRDRISRLGGHNSGFLGYGYRLNPAWTARASYGTAFHAPAFNDLYWPVDPVNFFQGNPGLKPEQAKNREIGLIFEKPGLHLGVTAYHNKISNLIDYTPGVAPTFIGTMSNLNSATIKGLTLDFSARDGTWSWRGSLDFLNAQDDVTGNTLQRRAPRTANLELRRDFGRLDLGARAQAVSGRFNDRANTQTLSGHAIINLDLGYRIDPDWRLEARLSNLFDRDYTQVRSTLPPYNDYAVPGRELFLGLRYAPK